MYNRSFFHTAVGWWWVFHLLKREWTHRRLACFAFLLRLRRPHEQSSRPPRRPSPGAVKAGGHGSGRSNEKSASRRENGREVRRSRGIQPWDDTIMDILHIFLFRNSELPVLLVKTLVCLLLITTYEVCIGSVPYVQMRYNDKNRASAHVLPTSVLARTLFLSCSRSRQRHNKIN